MAVETYYLRGTKATGINHLAVDTSAPASADLADTGWDMSGGGATAGEYGELYANVVRASAVFTATAVPTTIDTTNGNGWRLTDTAKTGTYAAGNWTFSFRMKEDSGANRDGAVSFLLWKSSNADGSGGSAVGVRTETSTGVDLGTGKTLTAAYDPSGGAGLTLSNEYLFLLAAMVSVDAGGTAIVHFREGGTHVTTTTDFTATSATVATSTSNRQALLRRRMNNGRRRK